MFKAQRRRSVDTILKVYHKLIDELRAVEQYSLDEVDRLKDDLHFHSNEAIKARAAITHISKILPGNEQSAEVAK